MIVPLAVGYLADLLLGDPRSWPHPVKGFGWMIATGERWLNRGRGRLAKGFLLVVVLCAAVYFGSVWLLAVVEASGGKFASAGAGMLAGLD